MCGRCWGSKDFPRDRCCPGEWGNINIQWSKNCSWARFMFEKVKIKTSRGKHPGGSVWVRACVRMRWVVTSRVYNQLLLPAAN